MVDYSKWDRLDLGDSDSDAGRADNASADPRLDALRYFSAEERAALAELHEDQTLFCGGDGSNEGSGPWTDDDVRRADEEVLAELNEDQQRRGSRDGDDPLPSPNQPGDDPAGKEKAKASPVYNERKLRSQRSQRRLQGNRKTCEHCGVDDDCYKLRVCSGCNLALYCSAACQKAASTSHRRICSITSELPPRDFDRLILTSTYGRDEMVDLDAALRYATKYMTNLKHLIIDVKEMASGDALKLSAKQLSSLFSSKKGVLESLFWVQNGRAQPGIPNGDEVVWKELHGLKQLHLYDMRFYDVLPIRDIILRQKDTLKVLGLPYLDIAWTKAKNRRTIAQAVNSCKHLVQLDLRGGSLMDSDLKVMLQDLPYLRILRLTRDTKHSHEFTDNTCGIIARKCPSLQELNLSNHNQLSVRGIRKIFEGCIELRSFYTTTYKLSGKEIQTLLDSAPQLLHLSLDIGIGTHISEYELFSIIEKKGGRIVFQWSDGDILQPRSVSAKTSETYGRRIDELNKIWSSGLDPVVANEWVDFLTGPPPIDAVSEGEK